MGAQALTLEHVAAMPAATWHFLKMNDTTVDIPAGFDADPHVRVSEPWSAHGGADEFEDAMTDAQERWESTHPEPTAAEIAERAEFLAAEADATYGGTAQSAYQAKADAVEESRSLTAAFENGMGEEVAAYLRHAAGKRVVVVADPGEEIKAQVMVASAPSALSVAAIDVVAGRDSQVALSVVVDSPDDGPQADGQPLGFTGTTMRVFADEGSKVEVVRTQTLDAGYVDIDDMGLFASEQSRVSVRQTVLGGAKTHTGLACDLRGEAADIVIDTRYLGHADQVHDFNYIVRHHGEKTTSNINANGVLAGKSSKTLRGTIDLIRGCKGAEGAESETVLLVDEGVRNKTVPTILCNEDDVAGNHGATIGHIREEQLFYLASRGLSQEAAEGMFVGAMLEQAAIDAPDEEARAGVLRLGEAIVPGFAGLFGE